MIASCGSDDNGGTPSTGTPAGANGLAQETWDGRTIAQANDDLPFFLILINSQRLTLGENRLQFALQDRDGDFVEHAEGEVRLYHLGAEPVEPELTGTFPLIERTLDYYASADRETARLVPAGTDAQHPIALVPPALDDQRFTHHDGEHATIFTATVDFDRTGTWGVELDVELDGERYENVRARIIVQERLAEPMIGERVPASQQPTVNDVDDITEIDSTMPPNPEMHRLTVADALELGEPFVVAFVTPAFCQTRFCGPIMEAVLYPAWQQYGDDIHFLHIEPYDLALARQGQLQAAPTTMEWQLTMEPIIFVVDADGTVAAKFDGIVELEELAEALDSLLAVS